MACIITGYFRSKASFLEGKQKLAMLKPVMNNLQILNREELLIKEPALSRAQSKLFGGIYCPSDISATEVNLRKSPMRENAIILSSSIPLWIGTFPWLIIGTVIEYPFTG